MLVAVKSWHWCSGWDDLGGRVSDAWVGSHISIGGCRGVLRGRRLVLCRGLRVLCRGSGFVLHFPFTRFTPFGDSGELVANITLTHIYIYT